MLIRFMALVISVYSYGSRSPHPLGVWAWCIIYSTV